MENKPNQAHQFAPLRATLACSCPRNRACQITEDHERPKKAVNLLDNYLIQVALD